MLLRTWIRSQFPIAAPVLVMVLALVAAAALAASPTTAAAQTNACPEPERPADPAEPRVVVTSPQAGAQVTSPVTIAGEAAVFEATIQIRIFDAQGNIIVDTFGTALGAGPEMWPFEEQVAFSVAADQQGCIWVFEESAEDGEPQEVVAIPVTLLATETGFSIEPHPAGLTITQYTGTLVQFEIDGQALDLVSCWATVQGQFIGYVFGAPAFVNAQFVAAFATGMENQGLICRRA